ncbi:MAG: hypothetical protein AB7V58_14175 [Solirubrobacterales bacterium]
MSERRAQWARLSLCLVAALLIAASASSRAFAAPISPKLLRTDPISSQAAPATTTTPLVFGEAEPEDGIVISGFPGWLSGTHEAGVSAVEEPTEHPEYEIFIFGQSGCVGGPIGIGTAGALEETGIAVTVAPDAHTTLSAAQVDPANPTKFSACSGVLSYWEGNVPPEEGGSGGEPGGSGEGGGNQGGGGSGGGGSTQAPSGGGGTPPTESVGPGVTTGKPQAPRLHLTSKAVANNNTPIVAGSAPGAGSVLLYANGNCGGSPVTRGSADQLSAGFSVPVADNTTTSFSAIAVGGQRSDCSDPVTYVEDSLRPRTRVTMGPGVKTRKRRAVFRFADAMEDQPGTSFRCKVGKRKWRPCASPFRLKHLKVRRYVVRIRAIDVAGNREKRGARRIFKVVRRH